MLLPGKYVNKRGQKLRLEAAKHNENLLTDGSSFYTHTGTCMWWSEKDERFFMDTDPKKDLDLSTPYTPKCSACQRPLEK